MPLSISYLLLLAHIIILSKHTVCLKKKSIYLFYFILLISNKTQYYLEFPYLEHISVSLPNQHNLSLLYLFIYIMYRILTVKK